MFEKLFKYEPTEQENEFIEIVKDLLKHPDTTVRMSFYSRKYFLTNEKKHYHMMLQYPNIQVTNTKFSFCKSMHPKAFDIVLEIVNTFIEKDRQALEDQIFQNEKNMLREVRNNLQLT